MTPASDPTIMVEQSRMLGCTDRLVHVVTPRRSYVFGPWTTRDCAEANASTVWEMLDLWVRTGADNERA